MNKLFKYCHIFAYRDSGVLLKRHIVSNYVLRVVMIIKLWLLSLSVSSGGAANNITVIVQCGIAICDAYETICILTSKYIIYKI